MGQKEQKQKKPCMQVQFPQEALHLNLDVRYCMVEKFAEAAYDHLIYQGVDTKAFEQTQHQAIKIQKGKYLSYVKDLISSSI